MLACWRMGAVALPCNPQLRRKDLELRARAAGPKLCVGEARYLAELPDGIPYMDMDDLARVFDEDLDQETPAAMADLAPSRPGGDRLHLGHDRRAARRRLPAALPGRPGAAGEALVRRPRRRDRLVHGGAGLVEVDPQRLHRPLARRARSPSSTTAASTPPSGCASARSSASTSSARRRPSTACWPSAASWRRSPACGGWSPPASRSSPT